MSVMSAARNERREDTSVTVTCVEKEKAHARSVTAAAVFNNVEIDAWDEQNRADASER